MTPLMIVCIESKLRENCSPEQISGWFLKIQTLRISYETIYLHIRTDTHAGGDLYKHFRRMGKKYQS
ncbi:MAG: IS30 family transposase [Motiliproteus sp.]|jgi:IS30 family transposase